MELKALDALAFFWDHWKFESLQTPYRGVERTVTFVKGGFMGEVGRYYVRDLILFESQGWEELWHTLRPRRETQNQRLLVLLPDGEVLHRRISFWLGFRGFAEVLLWPAGKSHQEAPKSFTDLVYLCNRGFELLEGKGLSEEGAAEVRKALGVLGIAPAPELDALAQACEGKNE